MNKSELTHALAEKLDITNAAANAAINAFMGVVEDALKKGEDIALVGFGTFKLNHRPAREGRNPRTGEALKIAAAAIPKFVPGKSLKEAVANVKQKKKA